MKKVSEWLSDIDGHSAMSVELARPDFEKETGEKWPEYLKGQPVKDALRQGRKDPKGLQGWDGALTDHVIAGYQLAAALAEKLAGGFRSSMLGRGSEFRDCLEAIRKAGK